MDRDEIIKHYRGPSIDASYQVSVHLAEGFQRRRLKCEKLTDDGCQVMAKAHIAFGKVSSKCKARGSSEPVTWPKILCFLQVAYVMKHFPAVTSIFNV